MNIQEHTIQLFCLPFSGGKAKEFEVITSKLNSEIDVYHIEYAGRGTRRKDSFFNDYDSFINDVVKQINMFRSINMPYMIFGYSFGAVLAYDIASRKLISGELKHVFIGGCCSLNLLRTKYSKEVSKLNEKEFWDEIIAMGGVKNELLLNKKFLKLFSKELRSDFKIAEQYVYNTNSDKPDCSATIMYSESDIKYSDVYGWHNLFKGVVEFELFSGNHFFAFNENEKTAMIINKKWRDVL